MTDDKLPGEEKTVDEPVEGAGSAPKAGLEREDAQPDEATELSEAVDQAVTYAEGPHAIETRTGMWSSGSGDTSGYGRIVRVVEMPSQPLPSDGWYAGVTARLDELVPDALVRVVFDRGEGAWLIAKNGDRYLDFGSGIALVVLARSGAMARGGAFSSAVVKPTSMSGVRGRPLSALKARAAARVRGPNSPSMAPTSW